VNEPFRVGRYALFDALASGGMATVHLGRLTGSAGFSRTVAIKRLHPHLAQEEDFVSMLVDEARLAGRIRHPNVVPTLDVVQLEGELMLIMEYVHGEALNRLIKHAAETGVRIPIPIASAILIAMLQGLHAAHEAKDERGIGLEIVHRDMSPHNVIVGIDGIPRILDFGVAKATGRLNSTGDGQLKGKLAYMSPEQLHGHTSDRRVDVWAAGVVLWELLCSRRLFSAESDVLVIPRVLCGPLERPRTYVEIAPELEAVVMKAIERDLSARYATALEMAIALERVAPPATTRAVAQWLLETAGAHLEARSSLLAEVESWVDGDISAFEQGARAVRAIASSPTVTGISGIRESARGLATSSASVVLPLKSDPYVTRITSQFDVPARTPPSKRSLYAVAALLAFAMIAVFMIRRGANHTVPFALGQSNSGTSALEPSAIAPPSTTAATGSTLESDRITTSGASTATATATATGASSRGGPHISKPPRPLPQRPTATATQPARTPVAPKPNCDPPYTIGPAPDFIRRPKLECL
jgi:eukaryotic-like serine/threonine-protein kinase